MKNKPASLVTQSLVLKKERFRTKRQAVAWARDNGFSTTKVDETENTWRFRQRDPENFRPRTFRTIEISDGVLLVSARLKRRYLSDPGSGTPRPGKCLVRGGCVLDLETGRWS